MRGSSYESKDSQRRTFAFVEVADETFDWWTDYTLHHDLLNGSASFQFHAPALPRAEEGRSGQLEDLDARGLRRGMQVKVYIKTPQSPKPVLQSTGLIDDVEMVEGRDEGAVVSVTGRDHLAPIADSDLLPSIALEHVTYAEVVRRVLTGTMPGQPRPFFKTSDLLIDNDANRILTTGKAGAGVSLSGVAPKHLESYKVDQIKPHPGETVYAFLVRHARRFGLLIWGTADGKIVFGRPNYDQKPIGTLTLRQGERGLDNNVQKFRRRLSFKHRPAEVHVYGRSKGGDHMKSSIHAVAYDAEVRDAGLWRVLTVHDNNARTKAEAEERALYELSVRRQTGDILNAELAGHANDDGVVWAIDTVVGVAWDKAGLFDDRYVIGRTFSRTRYGGTKTSLELVPKHSIALGVSS